MTTSGIESIEALFYRYGSRPHRDAAQSILGHALQCAHLAEHAGCDDALVTAALLLDLGELMAFDRSPSQATQAQPGCNQADLAIPDSAIPDLAIPFLNDVFGAAVVGPIELQRQAKRYLSAVDPDYMKRLSPNARARLAQLGGPFDAAACELFAARAGAWEALLLRRWDDAAQPPNLTTPSLEHFLERARRCVLVPA